MARLEASNTLTPKGTDRSDESSEGSGQITQIIEELDRLESFGKSIVKLLNVQPTREIIPLPSPSTCKLVRCATCGLIAPNEVLGEHLKYTQHSTEVQVDLPLRIHPATRIAGPVLSVGHVPTLSKHGWAKSLELFRTLKSMIPNQ